MTVNWLLWGRKQRRRPGRHQCSCSFTPLRSDLAHVTDGSSNHLPRFAPLLSVFVFNVFHNITLTCIYFTFPFCEYEASLTHPCVCAGTCDLHLGVLCWIRPLIDGGGREPHQGYSDDGLSEQVSRAPPLREPQRSRKHWGGRGRHKLPN